MCKSPGFSPGSGPTPSRPPLELKDRAGERTENPPPPYAELRSIAKKFHDRPTPLSEGGAEYAPTRS